MLKRTQTLVNSHRAREPSCLASGPEVKDLVMHPDRKVEGNSGSKEGENERERKGETTNPPDGMCRYLSVAEVSQKPQNLQIPPFFPSSTHKTSYMSSWLQDSGLAFAKAPSGVKEETDRVRGKRQVLAARAKWPIRFKE